MSGLEVALILVGLLLAVVSVLVMGVSRLRTLARRVGSFECAYKRGHEPGSPWVAGIGQYGVDRLYWWRSWSLAARPSVCWRRSHIVVVERAVVDDVRGFEGHVLVRCTAGADRFDLLVSSEAYAGLTSWLEAAPPVISRVI